jgi:predicted HTH transcriptional regulator
MRKQKIEKEVQDEYLRSGGHMEPEWQELGAAFRVIFYPHPDMGEPATADVPVNVPVNVPVYERQRWFLEQLSAGRQIKALDIAAHWQTSDKTAKRDIAELKKHGLIDYIGSSRKGSYQIKQNIEEGGGVESAHCPSVIKYQRN